MLVYQKADRLIPSFRSLPPRSPRLRARQIGSIAAAEQLSAEGTGSLVQSPPPPLTAETGPVRREYPRQFGKKRSIKNPVARSCDFLPPPFFLPRDGCFVPIPKPRQLNWLTRPVRRIFPEKIFRKSCDALHPALPSTGYGLISSPCQSRSGFLSK